MSDKSSVRKRIVICCDGTWQSSVSGEANVPSNVTRLCRHIARTDKDGTLQLVYYDSGVGTGSLTSWEKSRQGAVGDGLAVNVIEAYNFIVLNYSPGDEIFCFGFSRGAYTARAVAGLVADLGIISPTNMDLFPEIYNIYKKNIPNKDNGYVQTPFRDTKGWEGFVGGKLRTTPEAIKLHAEVKARERKCKEKRRKEEERKKKGPTGERSTDEEYTDEESADEGSTEEGPTEEEKRIIWEVIPHGEVAISEESRTVKVVGVWDTVGALGVPDGRWINNSGSRTEHGFHNVKLNKNIEHAFQALALDEGRKAFSPTLWYIPNDELEKESKSKSKDSSKTKSKDSSKAKSKDSSKTKSKDSSKPEPTDSVEENSGDSRLLQVWFPGVHINIGGGSSDTAEGKGDAEQLANITFAWMIECVRPYLAFDELAIKSTVKNFKNFLGAIDCKNNHQHDPSQPSIWSQPSMWPGCAIKGIYNSLPYIVGKPPPPAPTKVNWGTAAFADSHQGVHRWQNKTLRQPGECTTEVIVAEDSMFRGWFHNDKVKNPELSKLGKTNEQVHPVARYRRGVSNEAREDEGGLKDWKFRLKAGGEGYEWYKGDGGVGSPVLQEYVIQKNKKGSFGNVERLVAFSGDAEKRKVGEKPVKDWLKQTDIQNSNLLQVLEKEYGTVYLENRV